jgi:hypothetical protein
MAITAIDIQRTSLYTYTVTATSNLGGTPTFYWYHYDTLIGTNESGQWQFTVMPNEMPMFSVFDDAADTPGDQYPGKATISWQRIEGTKRYIVQEYVAAAWTNRGVIEDDGRSYYEFESRWLEDATEHEFRVLAEANNGVQSLGAQTKFKMRRVPDIPDVDYSYSSVTAKITVSDGS